MLCPNGSADARAGPTPAARPPPRPPISRLTQGEGTSIRSPPPDGWARHDRPRPRPGTGAAPGPPGPARAGRWRSDARRTAQARRRQDLDQLAEPVGRPPDDRPGPKPAAFDRTTATPPGRSTRAISRGRDPVAARRGGAGRRRSRSPRRNVPSRTARPAPSPGPAGTPDAAGPAASASGSGSRPTTRPISGAPPAGPATARPRSRRRAPPARDGPGSPRRASPRPAATSPGTTSGPPRPGQPVEIARLVDRHGAALPRRSGATPRREPGARRAPGEPPGQPRRPTAAGDAPPPPSGQPAAEPADAATSPRHPPAAGPARVVPGRGHAQPSRAPTQPPTAPTDLDRQRRPGPRPRGPPTSASGGIRTSRQRRPSPAISRKAQPSRRQATSAGLLDVRREHQREPRGDQGEPGAALAEAVAEEAGHPAVGRQPSGRPSPAGRAHRPAERPRRSRSRASAAPDAQARAIRGPTAAGTTRPSASRANADPPGRRVGPEVRARPPAQGQQVGRVEAHPAEPRQPRDRPPTGQDQPRPGAGTGAGPGRARARGRQQDRRAERPRPPPGRPAATAGVARPRDQPARPPTPARPPGPPAPAPAPPSRPDAREPDVGRQRRGDQDQARHRHDPPPARPRAPRPAPAPPRSPTAAEASRRPIRTSVSGPTSRGRRAASR